METQAKPSARVVHDVGVSDDFLRIIPATPDWVPAMDDANAAASIVMELCPAADAVELRWYERVVFVDQGANFEDVRCPSCKAVLPTPWWRAQLDQAEATTFADLATTTPCCATAASLNDLEYVWPAGFARFELEIRNPGRGWLRSDEIAQVADTLHRPVRQIFTHY